MQQSIDEIFCIRIAFPHPAPAPFGYSGLLPLLQYLESFPFPQPIQVQFSGKSKNRMRKKAIGSYMDPQLLAILEPEGTTGVAIEIFDPKKLVDNSPYPRLSISQGKYQHTLTLVISLDMLEQWGIPPVRDLFQNLVKLFPDAYIARGGFLSYQGPFYHKQLLSRPDYVFRGAFVPYLIWLQYIGAQELAIQGGRVAFEQNPMMKTRPLHEGLLIEVGESPYDIFTDEGEEWLVKATLSLPPVQR
jgi:hypothetical protein